MRHFTRRYSVRQPSTVPSTTAIGRLTRHAMIRALLRRTAMRPALRPASLLTQRCFQLSKAVKRGGSGVQEFHESRIICYLPGGLDAAEHRVCGIEAAGICGL